MRIEKRRVVLHIPVDLRRDLQELREYADHIGYSLMGEPFAHWLIRFMRSWAKRERKRLRRLELRIRRKEEEEAYRIDEGRAREHRKE
jgi:hypothetical protein